jgi:para-nitrobenzyl esterase
VLGPWAPQKYPTTPVFEVMTESGMSEDCLNLNVMTPAGRVNDRLPVLVWIHGGQLDILSGNQKSYNTPELPQHGAVVVTISHRLGPFGYMAHPLLTAESPNHASGNYAQLDLIAALQWVKKNIAAFGGDPDRLTIFGQSGGGRKVNWLMVSPLVPKGLFQGAWSESGSIDSITLAAAEASGVALANKLGASTLADLRAKTWQEIVQAASAIKYTAQLVEDGWSLLEPISNTFHAGGQQDVPYMIGMVGTEDAGHFNMPIQLVPTIKQLNSKVYAYVFTGIPAGWRSLGATGWHSLDLNYVFGQLASPVPPMSTTYLAYYIKRQCPACTLDPGINSNDLWLAETMKTMVVQFAKTGDPNISGLVSWPAYNPSTDQYLNIDVPLNVKSGFSTLTQ